MAGVSFLWTVIISMMRGALEKTPAPTSQQLDDAVAAVAAAAAAAAPVAAAEATTPAPATTATTALEVRQQAASADGAGTGGSCGVVASKGGARGPSGSGLGLKALVGAPEVQT